MVLEKRCLVMKIFVFSQFHYCPLVWMCHNRKLNKKLNRLREIGLREIGLRIVYILLLGPTFSSSITMLLPILEVIKF